MSRKTDQEDWKQAEEAGLTVGYNVIFGVSDAIELMEAGYTEDEILQALSMVDDTQMSSVAVERSMDIILHRGEMCD